MGERKVERELGKEREDRGEGGERWGGREGEIEGRKDREWRGRKRSSGRERRELEREIKDRKDILGRREEKDWEGERRE